MTYRSLISLALVAVLASCSRDEGQAAAPVASDSATAATAAAPAEATSDASTAAAGAGAIHVQITGGAHAGTYDIANTDGCSFGLAEKGAWGNQFSRDSEDPGELSSVQLIVPNSQAAAAGTKQFLMTVAFGPMFGEGATQYTVDTRAAADKGQGTVTVEDRGQNGTVSFDATTADGVQLKGTIECGGVLRA